MLLTPTDGNAIAADEHYNQPRREDYLFCDRCRRWFDDVDCTGGEDEAPVQQHSVMFSLCDDCGDELEAAK